MDITLSGILSALSPKEREKLIPIDFEKDQILCHEGDACRGVHFVAKGEIKIVSYSLEGKEIIYNVVPSGGIFGNHLAFSTEPYYRGSAIGEDKGRAYYVKKSDLIDIFQHNPTFLERYLNVLSDFGKDLNAKIHLLSLPTGLERLEYYLYLHQGSVRISSVTALAKDLAISREACSRLLSSAERDGNIVREGKVLWLRRE